MAGLMNIAVQTAGIPCYVDEGTHVGLDEKPFWYVGVLTVYHMGRNYTRMELHDPAAVEPAKKKVSAMAERLRAEGGGLISIFYHPCEWVHREFWDGVNFRRGANPPRESWRPPPQRPAEETEAAFRRFAEYLDHIRSIPDLRFVTAADLPQLYPDRAHGDGASEKDLLEIARRISNSGATNLDFQVLGNRAYSLAEQFELLAVAVSQLIEGRTLTFSDPSTGPLRAGSAAPSGAGRAAPELVGLSRCGAGCAGLCSALPGDTRASLCRRDPCHPLTLWPGWRQLTWPIIGRGDCRWRRASLLGRNLAPPPSATSLHDSPGLLAVGSFTRKVSGAENHGIGRGRPGP
jgi:hypothetical protein